MIKDLRKKKKTGTRPFYTQPQTDMISSQNIAKVFISKQVSLSQSLHLIIGSAKMTPHCISSLNVKESALLI